MAQEQSSLTQLLVALTVLLVLAGCSAAPSTLARALRIEPNNPSLWMAQAVESQPFMQPR